MGLDNAGVVDAVGIERTTGSAILTIADAWDWMDERTHLLALQAKLNRYFGFVESGEVFEAYPEARGRSLVIDVVVRYPICPAGVKLLRDASAVASELGIEIRSREYKGVH